MATIADWSALILADDGLPLLTGDIKLESDGPRTLISEDPLQYAYNFRITGGEPTSSVEAELISEEVLKSIPAPISSTVALMDIISLKMRSNVDALSETYSLLNLEHKIYEAANVKALGKVTSNIKLEDKIFADSNIALSETLSDVIKARKIESTATALGSSSATTLSEYGRLFGDPTALSAQTGSTEIEMTSYLFGSPEAISSVAPVIPYTEVKLLDNNVIGVSSSLSHIAQDEFMEDADATGIGQASSFIDLEMNMFSEPGALSFTESDILNNRTVIKSILNALSIGEATTIKLNDYVFATATGIAVVDSLIHLRDFWYPADIIPPSPLSEVAIDMTRRQQIYSNPTPLSITETRLKAGIGKAVAEAISSVYSLLDIRKELFATSIALSSSSVPVILEKVFIKEALANAEGKSLTHLSNIDKNYFADVKGLSETSGWIGRANFLPDGDVVALSLVPEAELAISTIGRVYNPTIEVYIV